ncbi:MAG: hypothetical protein RLZZ565_1356, partial [Planctomycetota bacterium]
LDTARGGSCRDHRDGAERGARLKSGGRDSAGETFSGDGVAPSIAQAGTGRGRRAHGGGGWTERAVPLRIRQEVQAVSRQVRLRHR